MTRVLVLAVLLAGPAQALSRAQALDAEGSTYVVELVPGGVVLRSVAPVTHLAGSAVVATGDETLRLLTDCAAESTLLDSRDWPGTWTEAPEGLRVILGGPGGVVLRFDGLPAVLRGWCGPE